MRNIVSPLDGIRSPFVSRGFSPRSLFSLGEVGAWYDPSDLSTMFTDSAGTTPVTAVGQAVGLILDKSQNGVGTNGAKRVNLFTYTEDFSNAAWTKNAVTVSANSVVAPDGTTTADTVTEAATTDLHVAYQIITPAASTSYTLLVYAKANTRTHAMVRVGGGALSPAPAIRATLSGAGSVTTLEGSVTASSITSVGDGWYRISMTFTSGTATGHTPQCGPHDGGSSTTFAGDISKSIYVWGADFRLASEASTAPTPYQRITADWPSTIAGNHASQSTPTARPLLSARVNLLTYSEDFSNAAWVAAKSGTAALGVKTNNYGTAPDGTTTAARIQLDVSAGSSGNASQVYQLVTVISGASYKYSAWIKTNDGTTKTIMAFSAGTTTPTSLTITGTWTRFEALRTPGSTSDAFQFVLIKGTTSDTADLLVWHPDVRASSEGTNLPTYQRIAAATDYDTSGFPLYLSFDGTDDFLVTGTINPGSVDKAQIWAGVRKLSDVSRGVLVELSATRASNNGAFTIDAPGATAATDKYVVASKGTVDAFSAATAAGLTAPVTNVLAAICDISGDVARLRANGTQVAEVLTDQGTGNYGSYALYIGRRGGTTLPFNGNIYSLIVRFSAANLADSVISQAETWVNGKTRAY